MGFTLVQLPQAETAAPKRYRLKAGPTDGSPMAHMPTSNAEAPQEVNRDAKSNRADTVSFPWGMSDEATDMMSFGLAKKLGAGATSLIDSAASAATGGEFNPGERYANNLEGMNAAQRQFGEEHPGRKLAGQGVGLGVSIAKMPAVKLLEGAGLLPKIANTAATGGLYGAIGGAAQDADSLEEHAKNAVGGGAWGTVLGPLSIPLSKGLGKIVSSLKSRGLTVPSIDQLRQAASNAYQAADDAGVQIAQPAYQKVVEALANVAENGGFHPRLHPRIGVALDEIKALSGSSPTLKQTEQLRRIIGTAGESTDASERRLGGLLRDNLDDMIEALPDESIAAGDKGGITALKEARNLWSRVKQSEMVEDAITKATRRGEANMTTNTEQAVKQNFRQILDSPKRMRGVGPEMEAALETATRGSVGQKLLHWAGKAAPQSAVSSIPSILIGSNFGSIPGVALALAGSAAKAASTGMTMRNARLVQAIAQNGGALPQADTQKLQAIVRALLSVQAGRAGGQLAGQ